MSKINSFEETKNRLSPELFESIEKHFKWELIDKFYDFLYGANERGGFFSKRDSLQIFERHIFDSLIYVWKLKNEGLISRETKIADIGTGPGVPGFLFLCLNETPNVTLIDSQRRKLSILEEEVVRGNLSEINDKVKFEYIRAEEEKRSFDLVTSRAMVPYPFIVEVTCKMVKKNGLLCPFLGQLNFDSLIEKQVLGNNGFKLIKEIELIELSFVGKRHIKILQKDSVSKPGYPRPWKEIVKETKVENG